MVELHLISLAVGVALGVVATAGSFLLFGQSVVLKEISLGKRDRHGNSTPYREE